MTRPSQGSLVNSVLITGAGKHHRSSGGGHAHELGRSSAYLSMKTEQTTHSEFAHLTRSYSRESRSQAHSGAGTWSRTTKEMRLPQLMDLWLVLRDFITTLLRMATTY